MNPIEGLTVVEAAERVASLSASELDAIPEDETRKGVLAAVAERRAELAAGDKPPPPIVCQFELVEGISGAVFMAGGRLVSLEPGDLFDATARVAREVGVLPFLQRVEVEA